MGSESTTSLSQPRLVHVDMSRCCDNHEESCDQQRLAKGASCSAPHAHALLTHTTTIPCSNMHPPSSPRSFTPAPLLLIHALHAALDDQVGQLKHALIFSREDAVRSRTQAEIFAKRLLHMRSMESVGGWGRGVGAGLRVQSCCAVGLCACAPVSMCARVCMREYVE